MCRHELAGLRATLSKAADADVPEPSPLFWDHLSARIKAAVEQEAAGPRATWELLGSPWRMAAVAAAGVAAARLRPDVPHSPGRAAGPHHERSTPTVRSARQSRRRQCGDDPSLDLIVDLAGDLEWDDAAAAGLVVRGDVVEQAVRDLSNDERIELLRVLREAIDGARAGGRGV